MPGKQAGEEGMGRVVGERRPSWIFLYRIGRMQGLLLQRHGNMQDARPNGKRGYLGTGRVEAVPSLRGRIFVASRRCFVFL